LFLITIHSPAQITHMRTMAEEKNAFSVFVIAAD